MRFGITIDIQNEYPEMVEISIRNGKNRVLDLMEDDKLLAVGPWRILVTVRGVVTSYEISVQTESYV